MAKRIALIGLSTPVAYDYGVEATPTKADMNSSPNPILDSPFGLMLLYDELWFVSRSLCPENMRGCSFVRFLDEDGALTELGELDIEEEYEAYLAAEEKSGRQPGFANAWRRVDAIPRNWDARWDNHTHGLDLAGKEAAGNSADPRLILLDLAIIEHLNQKGLELAGNTVGQERMEVLQPSVRRADLAHVLTIGHLPNYLSAKGPYHPVIDEVREDRFLKDFRRWITETSETSTEEAAAIKATVEKGLRRAQREAFLAHLNPRAHYETVGKTLTGVVGDLIVPGVGTAGQLIQDVRDMRSVRNERWQGFLLGMEAAAESIAGPGPGAPAPDVG